MKKERLSTELLFFDKKTRCRICSGFCNKRLVAGVEAGSSIVFNVVNGGIHNAFIFFEHGGSNRLADRQNLKASFCTLIPFQNVQRRVADIGNCSLTGLTTLGKGQVEDNAFHRVVFVGHIGVEVTQAVGHEALLLLAISCFYFNLFHGANNMAVGTEDHVNAVLEH